MCLASQGAAEAVLAGSAAGSLFCLLIFLPPPPSFFHSFPPSPFFHLKALQILVFLFLAEVPADPLVLGLCHVGDEGPWRFKSRWE